MNFRSYFVLSSFVVVGVVANAYIVHEQFHPAVTYLSTDKLSLAVMYNFAFAILLLFGKVLLKVFIGSLRDLEVEQLIDNGRGFLADTILFLVFYAPTIDNKEVGTVYLIQYICCVIFMKVFHLTTQIRVSHMFEVGVPRLLVSIKLVSLMLLLLFLDGMALRYFYSVSSKSSTFFTWILFEALTMSTVVLVSICKYAVHMVDLRLDNGWPGKSVCLFYIDLVHDVSSMTLFLVFMLTFFVQNPSRLPIYMMADIFSVARKLAQRLRSFRRYRRISMNMEARLPDATDEEIEQNEHCVICRDSLFDGSKPKKLPCGHIFHIDCLRSWLVMQQCCPTCRADIPAELPSSGQPQAVVGAGQPAPPPVAAGAGQQPAAAGAAHGSAGGATSSSSSSAVPSGGAAAAQQPLAPAAATIPPASAGAPASTSPSSCPAASGAASAVAAPAAAVPSASASASASSIPPPAGSSPAQAPAHHAAASGNADLAAAFGGEAYGSAAGSLPPVREILDALARAEEVSKFLRQQADFWMEQVRQIEQAHRHPTEQALGGNVVLSQPPASSTVSVHPCSTQASSSTIVE